MGAGILNFFFGYRLAAWTWEWLSLHLILIIRKGSGKIEKMFSKIQNFDIITYLCDVSKYSSSGIEESIT